MNCSICKIVAAAPQGYLFESKHWLIRHSSETNIEGYLILEARRHILDLADADAEEIAEFGRMMAMATRAIRRVVQPEKVYTFTLAESMPHMHMHLIPRNADMPRAWRGRGIMSYPLTPGVNAAILPQISQSMEQELKRQWQIVAP